MKLARRVQALTPSTTLAITAKAKEMKEKEAKEAVIEEK